MVLINVDGFLNCTSSVRCEGRKAPGDQLPSASDQSSTSLAVLLLKGEDDNIIIASDP